MILVPISFRSAPAYRSVEAYMPPLEAALPTDAQGATEPKGEVKIWLLIAAMVIKWLLSFEI
jgi:hypothetical protein